ncbi:MAG: T9SS type A sorting domain-containing protein, partial [Ignavibacteriales bacterium]|nr:T9SS type A sorting domain-containing protein [Ignavibacteriales bacterium]
IQHSWKVLDGGGGKSTGDVYTLNASVGQAAAQRMVSIDVSMIMEGGYIPGLRNFSGAWTTATIAPLLSWNLLSVPLLTNDMRKIALYSSAISPAFIYEPGGYIQADSLELGKSYWLKFPTPAPSPYEISGTAVVTETVFVFQGWNMIGAISYPSLTSSITPLPPVEIISKYFGYEGGIGYYGEDTLKCGIGYWVKTSRAGNIVIAGSNFLAAPNLPAAIVENNLNQKGTTNQSKVEDGFLKFIVQDSKGAERKLFFSTKSIPVNEYELPPVPPEGLDVRFASGRNAEMPNSEKGLRQEFPIRITGGEFPITLKWNGSSTDEANLVLEVSYAGEKPKQYSLGVAGNLTIDEDDFIGAKLAFTGSPVKELPKAFALYQNYPNPFNPTTNIKYDLPMDAKVSLRVFNVLGEEVSVLADGMQEAGFKSVQFDASGLPSGFYFYRLQANDYSMARKFVLVR